MPIYEKGTGKVDPYVKGQDMKAVWIMRNGSKTKIWPSYQEIDYFEDGNLNEYVIPGSTGTASLWSNGFPNDVSGGEQTALKLDQYVRMFSLEGDGLDNYPGWGISWEFYFRPVTFYNTPAFLRCNFMALDGYDTSDCYRLEWESDPTSGSDMSLEKRAGGSNVIQNHAGDGVGVDTQTTYRCVVHMVEESGNAGHIIAEWWNHETNTKINELRIDDGSQHYGPAIGFETNGYMEAGFDVARILP
jgi:hypothetical protein